MAARPITPPEEQFGARQTLLTASIISPSKRPRDADEAGSPPITPSKRACVVNGLNLLLISLSDEFGFNLRGHEWTPSKRRGHAEEECRAVIQQLYWRDRDGLTSCIQKFRYRFTERDKTVVSFAQLLKAQRETSHLSPRQIRSANSSRTTSANTSFVCSVPGPDTAQTSFSSVFQETRLNPSEHQNAMSSAFSASSQDVRFLADNWDTITGHTKSFKPIELPIEETESTRANNLREVQKSNIPPTMTREPHIHYKIRGLPQAGLFVEELPTTMLEASPHVRYEMVRISNESNMPIHILSSEYEQTWEVYDVFQSNIRNILSRHAARVTPPHCSQRAWDSASLDVGCEHVVRTAKLIFNVEPGNPLFKLSLTPLSYETTSTRFFRKFGAHRFLKVFIPPLKTIPSKIGKSDDHLHDTILKWLDQADKPFMGYFWNAFHTKPHKERRKSRNRGKTNQETGGYQVYFFATSGINLQTNTIADLLNWFMPIDLNLNQPYCKAYARLELASICRVIRGLLRFGLNACI